MTPVRMPGKAVGSMTRRTVWARVAPMPMAASRMRAGTMRMASSEVRMIVGSMSSERAAARNGGNADHHHQHAVGHHPGENRRVAAEGLGREAHRGCQLRIRPDLSQEDRRHHADGHGNHGGNDYNHQRPHNGVSKAPSSSPEGIVNVEKLSRPMPRTTSM